MMTELRRVELVTVQNPQTDKKVKKKSKTFRCLVVLGESNSTACPEYSFVELMRKEKLKNGMSDDPFGDEDEAKQVAAIAQRFEAKYGRSCFKSGKKKRTQDMDDFQNLGDGYDEEDPFIDNTEAYDEVVPSTLTTKYGGFYINQGKLDFKSLSEDSNEDFAISPKVIKKKKRIIESDSEEETGEALAKKFKAMKRKKLLESKQNKQGEPKRKLANDGEVIKKKKKKVDRLKTKKAPPPEQPPKADQPSKSPATSSSIVVASSNPTTAPPTLQPSLVSVSNPTVALAKDTCNEAQKDKPEEKEAKPSAQKVVPPTPAVQLETLKEDSSSKSGEDDKKAESVVEKNVQLPTQLPPQLSEAIENIKKEAKKSKEGKSKFFSSAVNDLLLGIEVSSLKLAKGHRTSIFNHLEEHLPCGKQALLRRSKKLRETQQENQLRGPIEKLKDAIRKAMPAQEQLHDLEVAKAKQEAKVDSVDAAKEDPSTESEEDEGKVDNSKKLCKPRKKFQWTPEIKHLFLEVVDAKMKLYDNFKSRNQTEEEFLKPFLESEIKTLWPHGWMQTRMLLKMGKPPRDETKGAKLKKPGGKASPVPEMSQRVSRTEEVIEISSFLEDSFDEKNRVVINLTDDKLSPSPPRQQLGSSVSILASAPHASNSFQLPRQSKPATKTGYSGLSLMGAGVPSHRPKVADSRPHDDSTISPAAKPISTAQVTEILDSPARQLPATKAAGLISTAQVIEILNSPARQSPATKATGLKSAGASMALTRAGTPLASKAFSASPQRPPTPSSRSFMAAFDLDKFKDTASARSQASTSQQQLKSNSANHSTSLLQQQQRTNTVTVTQKPKPVAEQSLPPQPALSLPQQKCFGAPVRFPSKQPHVQLKMGAAAAAQVRLLQDQKITSTMTKPSTLPTLSKEQVSSHWSNLNSITPSAKSINPVVAISRVSTAGLTSSLKQTQGSASKGSNSNILNSTSLQLQQKSNDSVASPVGSMKKGTQPWANSVSTHTWTSPQPPYNSTALSSSGHNQSAASLAHQSTLSSKHTLAKSSPGNHSSPVATSLSRSSASALSRPTQVKSGLVLGTSTSSVSKSNPQQPMHRQNLSNLKSGIVISAGATPPALSVRTSGLSSGRLDSKNSPHNTPGALIPSTSHSLYSSRTSTSSPQKSPSSPGGFAHLYEQIQLVCKQEALEKEGLEVLRRAAAGKLGHMPGNKSDGNGSLPGTGKR